MRLSFQSVVRSLRRIIPRGWAPTISFVARWIPNLQHYKARMADGEVLILDLRYYMCFGYFFYGRLPHEAGTEMVVRRLLRAGDTFVDVGANIGYYSRVASGLVGTTGAVIAIEPTPVALRCLRLNAERLGNVTIHPVALGERCGKATFFVRKLGDTSSLARDAEADPILVDVLTLDEIAKGQQRVGLLKIDVEGFELQVLRGAEKTIQQHRPSIVLEFLPKYALDQGIELGDIEGFFSAFRYRVKWIEQTEHASVTFSEGPSTDLLAIPEERAASICAALSRYS